MKRMMVFAALLGLAGSRSQAADFAWTSSSWTLSTSTSGVSPPDALASATTANENADAFTGALSASADNPPGPGGPSVPASISFSRKFTISSATPNQTLSVPFRLAYNGTLFQSPVGGGNGSSLSVNASVFGDGMPHTL